MKRSVFFVSDRTGITAEVLGQAVLSQFDTIRFTFHTEPFIDTPAKAHVIVAAINEAAANDGCRPIVFDTIVEPRLRSIIRESQGLVLDFFQMFIDPLEAQLNVRSSFRVGRQHSAEDVKAYDHRISAVNYALKSDDGANIAGYDEADIILLGVSRCGKTPTSLFLAMQFGIRVANFPFIPQDMGELKLIPELAMHRQRLFGLTLAPDRLHEIRTARRANSTYASLAQCRYELGVVENLYRRRGIPFLDATSKSVEEIASRILVMTGLERHAY